MAAHTGLEAPKVLVAPLGLVALGHDGGDVATGGAVAGGGWHGSHLSGSIAKVTVMAGGSVAVVVFSKIFWLLGRLECSATD